MACSNTHLIFATYTKVGLHIGMSNQVPTEAVFAYKRFEGAIIPVDPSLRELRKRAEALMNQADEEDNRADEEIAEAIAAAEDAVKEATTNLANAEKAQSDAAGKGETKEADAAKAKDDAAKQKAHVEKAKTDLAANPPGKVRRRLASQLRKQANAIVQGVDVIVDASEKVAKQARALSTAETARAEDPENEAKDQAVEVARKDLEARRKELVMAYEAVSEMTPLYASGRVVNSWQNGLLVCQLFATGTAAIALLDSEDRPTEEAATCTRKD